MFFPSHFLDKSIDIVLETGGLGKHVQMFQRGCSVGFGGRWHSV